MPGTGRDALAALNLTWTRTADAAWSTGPGSLADAHVEGLHAGAVHDLAQAVQDALADPDDRPPGVVVRGAAGSGKTHLLGWLRERVQGAGGYFFLAGPLGVGVPFWEGVAGAVIDGLTRPAAGGETQLRLFLRRLADVVGAPQAIVDAVTGAVALEQVHLKDFVVALRSHDRRVGGDCQDTLRALVLFGSGRLEDEDVGRGYLQSMDEQFPNERAERGMRSPAKPASEIVRELSRLLALTGPSVIAVDQIDTAAALTVPAPPTADDDTPAVVPSPVVTEVADGLLGLHDRTARTLCVLTCLPATWDLLATQAVPSLVDRFRVLEPLGAIGSPALAHELLARRFAPRYASVGFTAPYPTWPVRPEALTAAADLTPGALLRRVDAQIRESLASEVGEVYSLEAGRRRAPAARPALESGPTTITVANRGIDPDSPAGRRLVVGFAELDVAWARLRAAAPGLALLTEQVEDEIVPDLFAAGLDAWIVEVGEAGTSFRRDPKPGAHPALHARLRRVLDDASGEEAHWSFRAIFATRPSAGVTRLNNAATMAGLSTGVGAGDGSRAMPVSAAAPGRRTLVVARTAPWNDDPVTARAVGDFERSGGLTVLLTAEDVRTLAALRQLLDSGHPALGTWLRARRPASSTAVLTAALGAVFDEFAPPAADYPPVVAAPAAPAAPSPFVVTTAMPTTPVRIIRPPAERQAAEHRAPQAQPVAPHLPPAPWAPPGLTAEPGWSLPAGPAPVSRVSGPVPARTGAAGPVVSFVPVAPAAPVPPAPDQPARAAPAQPAAASARMTTPGGPPPRPARTPWGDDADQAAALSGPSPRLVPVPVPGMTAAEPPSAPPPAASPAAARTTAQSGPPAMPAPPPPALVTFETTTREAGPAPAAPAQATAGPAQAPVAAPVPFAPRPPVTSWDGSGTPGGETPRMVPVTPMPRPGLAPLAPPLPPPAPDVPVAPPAAVTEAPRPAEAVPGAPLWAAPLPTVPPDDTAGSATRPAQPAAAAPAGPWAVEARATGARATGAPGLAGTTDPGRPSGPVPPAVPGPARATAPAAPEAGQPPVARAEPNPAPPPRSELAFGSSGREAALVPLVPVAPARQAPPAAPPPAPPPPPAAAARTDSWSVTGPVAPVPQATPVPVAARPAAAPPPPPQPVTAPAAGAAPFLTLGYGAQGPVALGVATLRRHTVVLAGNGAGKTVLLRRLVEECALRGVPSVLLDATGEMSRLGDPWPIAPLGWARGDAELARDYLEHTDVAIYTPGRVDGRPLPAVHSTGGETAVDAEQMLTPAPGFRARVSVVSLVGLPNEQARYHVAALVRHALHVWARRQPRVGADAPPRALFVLDEAHIHVPAGAPPAALAPMLDLHAEAGERGLGMVFAAQSPMWLAEQVPAGSATRLLGRLEGLNHVEAAQRIAGALGGDASEIGRLGTGEFYAASDGVPFQKLAVPLCLSYHPGWPPHPDEIAAKARPR